VVSPLCSFLSCAIGPNFGISGVVGGICALAIASIVACFVIRRRRRDKEKITPQYDEGPVSPWGTSPTSPSVTLKQYVSFSLTPSDEEKESGLNVGGF